ncbi:agrin-like [Schistocerca cancellata]|uniref:agrin-like n=1 Tax=Schistocerca cancellata TaxID=274614 RepID=UPI002118F8EE|nr:agrin-like [Schistocerca cancellata]
MDTKELEQEWDGVRVTNGVIQKADCEQLSCSAAVDPCLRLECGPWAQCQMASGVVSCVCLPCPAHHDARGPVCGSDGRDYDSECQLRAAACRQGLDDLYLRHRGSCVVPDACRGVVCEEPAAVCHHGVCACKSSCPQDGPKQRLCGSDGRTYDSECELQLASCLRSRGQHPITVASLGDCRDVSAEKDRQMVNGPACQTSPFGCCPDGETPAENGCPPPGAEDDSDRYQGALTSWPFTSFKKFHLSPDTHMNSEWHEDSAGKPNSFVN